MYSSCQADYFSSDNSENDGDFFDGQFGDEELGDGNIGEGELSDGEFSDGELSDGELSDGEPGTSGAIKKFTKRKTIELVKEEEGDTQKVAETMLKVVVGDSLDELGSQCERKKEMAVKNLGSKISKLVKADKEKKFRHRPEELEDSFDVGSQSSLKEHVKEGKSKEEPKLEDKTEERTVKNTKKIPRIPLNRCKRLEDAKDRTDDILGAVKDEAVRQMVTPTALLAFLLYRLNYVKRRTFAQKMLKLFENDEWSEEAMGVEKALALLERRKLGKGGYREVRKQLRPHGLVHRWANAIISNILLDLHL